MFSWCFLSVSRYFSIVRNLSREPDFWAENQIFKNFSKSLKTCLVGFFWEFHGIFSIIRHLSLEPDFSAKNRIFKKFLKCLKACLVAVVWVFQSILALFDIWAENRIFEPRTGFSKNFEKASKHVKLVFSEFQGIFSIVRHLSREPDVWAENRIFTNFFKSLKTCLVGVFWVSRYF